MKTTPRTNALVDKLESTRRARAYDDMVDHSRDLELELAESYKIITKMKKSRETSTVQENKLRPRGFWR
jgi:hypothetical protein